MPGFHSFSVLGEYAKYDLSTPSPNTLNTSSFSMKKNNKFCNLICYPIADTDMWHGRKTISDYCPFKVRFF
jgi:hypothetical protein